MPPPKDPVYLPPIRRANGSDLASAPCSRLVLVATHITLVAVAIREASLRAQIDATRQLIAVNTNLLQILRRRPAFSWKSPEQIADGAGRSALAVCVTGRRRFSLL
jgi:hypothetical protein